MVQKLTAKDMALTFRTEPNGWCRVELQFASKTIPLGADMEDIVVKRLASGLDKELSQQVVGKIKEIGVVSVIGLYENHTSIYAGNSGEYRVLFMRDREGKPFSEEFWLDNETRQQWFSALTAGCD